MNTTIRDALTKTSLVKYAVWRLLTIRSELCVKTRQGPRLHIRPRPSDDLSTAYQVYASDEYRVPKADAIRFSTVVDLGVNVGYSCLFWLSQYGAVEIIGYEPDQDNLRMLYRNFGVNKSLVSNKVRIVEGAAGTRRSTGHLTGDGAGVCVLATTADIKQKDRKVEIYDIFEDLGEMRIDLFKMDIEGGEYDILSDPRFHTLNIRYLVMEWHRALDVGSSGGFLCSRILEKYGFEILKTTEIEKPQGVLWAVKT